MGNLFSSNGKTIFAVEEDSPETQVINFPHPDNFAESTCVYEKDLLIPINGTDGGLYRYSYDDGKKEWQKKELLFSVKNGVVMGTKIHKDTIIGCIANLDRGILIFNIQTKDYKEIPIKGYANDICFDEEDPTIAYMCTNVDYQIYNCYVYKINLVTNEFERICVQGPFTGAVGINCLKGKIYVGTLHQIWLLDRKNPDQYEALEFGLVTNMAFPFYDNIVLNKEKGVILFAIFDAHQCFCYPILNAPCFLLPGVYLYSYLWGAGHGDIYNVNRKPDYQKVMYVIYNPETKQGAIKEIPFHSTFHDSCVTQITNYDQDMYIITNWKANFSVIKQLDMTFKDDNIFDFK